MTDETRPVADWENDNVRGLARVSKRSFDEHASEVSKLRKRQQAYADSLPKDIQEAMTEISSVCPNLNEPDDPSFAACAALSILHEFASRDIFEDCQDKQMKLALYWLTGHGLRGLKAIEQGSRQVRDIASQFHPSHEPYKA